MVCTGEERVSIASQEDPLENAPQKEKIEGMARTDHPPYGQTRRTE